jgi:hypothetical protein
VQEGDKESYREELVEGSEHHRKYYGGTKRRRGMPAGVFPLGLVALAALGHDRGFACPFTSDYLSASLLTGTFWSAPREQQAF